MAKGKKETIDSDTAHDQAEVLTTANSTPESDASVETCEVCEFAMASAIEDDVHMASELQWVANRYPNAIDRDEAMSLSAQLNPVGDDGGVKPMYERASSSRHVTKERIRHGSSFGRIFDEAGETWSAFEIMPRGCRVRHSELGSLSGPGLLDVLATTFDMVGIDDNEGMLLGFFYAESDPIRGLIRCGLRGVASAGIAKQIEGLSAFARFKDPEDFDGCDEFFEDQIGSRIIVNQGDRPAQHIQDLIQVCWPQRPTILRQDGSFKRDLDMRPVPQPLSSQIALWLDQWSLADLTLMIGLCEGDDGQLHQCHSFRDY